MDNYVAIKARIEKLEKQAAELRKSEMAGAISKIRTAIETYGLSADDLGFGSNGAAKVPARRGRPPGKTKAAAAPVVGAPKYRDPKTQKTWTGRGKPPAWIANVKNRDSFLINASGATESRAGGKGMSSAKSAKSQPAAKGKRGRKRSANVTPAVQIESGAGSE